MYYRVFRSVRMQKDGTNYWGISDKANNILHYATSKLEAHALCEQMEAHRVSWLRQGRTVPRKGVLKE